MIGPFLQNPILMGASWYIRTVCSSMAWSEYGEGVVAEAEVVGGPGTGGLSDALVGTADGVDGGFYWGLGTGGWGAHSFLLVFRWMRVGLTNIKARGLARALLKFCLDDWRCARGPAVGGKLVLVVEVDGDVLLVVDGYPGDFLSLEGAGLSVFLGFGVVGEGRNGLGEHFHLR